MLLTILTILVSLTPKKKRKKEINKIKQKKKKYRSGTSNQTKIFRSEFPQCVIFKSKCTVTKNLFIE